MKKLYPGDMLAWSGPSSVVIFHEIGTWNVARFMKTREIITIIATTPDTQYPIFVLSSIGGVGNMGYIDYIDDDKIKNIS